MQFKTIRLDVADHLATLTLNRPDKLNALSVELLLEMAEALKHVLSTQDIRALLITGAGRAFCTGADLSDASPPIKLNPNDPEQRLRDYYTPVFHLVMDMKIPTVAAVNGPCAGAGMSLAMICDITFAARSAYFIQAFVNVGLVPDNGSSWILPHTIGPARANALMLLGDRLPAETAAEWGLIWKCVDDDKLMEEAGAVACRLANGPTITYGQIKNVARLAWKNSLRDQIALESATQNIVRASEDSREARAAFVEKRKPKFTGK
ncbi:MAG TPA: enoyl-CoA hydratase-related protein [Burkholderiales bacterium]|nr:enoyl-CoA hydratase-related protein [Burkholderiales bacterium]